MDFRLHAFSGARLRSNGRYLGNRSYWKLYFVENSIRVTINSILTVEIGSNWWDVAVDTNIRTQIERLRSHLPKATKRSVFGQHGLYFIGLKDLNEIVRVHSNLIQPIIPDIQDWIVRIEQLRSPRNHIAHMNHPSESGLDLIDSLYKESANLVTWLEKKKIKVVIP